MVDPRSAAHHTMEAARLGEMAEEAVRMGERETALVLATLAQVAATLSVGERLKQMSLGRT